MQLYVDDIAPRAAFALVDAGNVSEIVDYLQSNVRQAPVSEGVTGD